MFIDKTISMYDLHQKLSYRRMEDPIGDVAHNHAINFQEVATMLWSSKDFSTKHVKRLLQNV